MTNCFSSDPELVITTKDPRPQSPERAGRCNRLHPVVWYAPYDYFMLHHTLGGLERHQQLICITSPPWGKLATFSFKKVGVLMRMCRSPIKVLAGARVYLSLNIKEADKPHILQLIEYWYFVLNDLFVIKRPTLMIRYDFIMTRYFGNLLNLLNCVWQQRIRRRYLQYNSARWAGLRRSSFLGLSFTGYSLRSKRQGRVPATSSVYYPKWRGKLIWYPVRFPVSWYAVYINV